MRFIQKGMARLRPHVDGASLRGALFLIVLALSGALASAEAQQRDDLRGVRLFLLSVGIQDEAARAGSPCAINHAEAEARAMALIRGAGADVIHSGEAMEQQRRWNEEVEESTRAIREAVRTGRSLASDFDERVRRGREEIEREAGRVVVRVTLATRAIPPSSGGPAWCAASARVSLVAAPGAGPLPRLRQTGRETIASLHIWESRILLSAVPIAEWSAGRAALVDEAVAAFLSEWRRQGGE